MARTSIQIVFNPPLRDIAGRFAKAKDEHQRLAVEQMKFLGRTFVGLEQSEAPKRTLKFASGIRFFPFVDGDTVGFKAISPGPLGDYIKFGTRPHEIRGNPMLKFFWDTGPRGAGVYFFRSVHHPGTKPNPYHERAFEKWEPIAEESQRETGNKLAAFLADVA